MIPAFQKSYDFYKNLYVTLRQIPKRDRYAWGEHCENMALDLLKAVMLAEYAPRPAKAGLLRSASNSVNQLKVFLRLGEELRILDRRHALARQTEMQEIGKMIGGWLANM